MAERILLLAVQKWQPACRLHHMCAAPSNDPRTRSSLEGPQISNWFVSRSFKGTVQWPHLVLGETCHESFERKLCMHNSRWNGPNEILTPKNTSHKGKGVLKLSKSEVARFSRHLPWPLCVIHSGLAYNQKRWKHVMWTSGPLLDIVRTPRAMFEHDPALFTTRQYM